MSKPARNPPVSDLIDHALARMAAADIESPEKAARIRGEMERWRAESALHDRAYDEALRRWNALGNAIPGLRRRFGQPVARKFRPRGMLCMAAIVAVLAIGIRWHRQRPVFEQTYQTVTAQIARVSLPDGSRIDVNARSRLRVTLYRSRRSIELVSGDARFEVAPGANKPFQVDTRAGVVEVIGTVFSVSDRGNRVVVEVEEGRVRFFGRGESTALELESGQRLLARENAAVRIERRDASAYAEWRDGWLVFDNEPLADAVLAINPYRKSPIRLADDKAGLLRLTGRFRAGDSQSLLAALPKILPITASEDFDGKVEIRRR
jgi:transmembrane sensor